MATLVTAFCPACDALFWPEEKVCVACGLVETERIWLHNFTGMRALRTGWRGHTRIDPDPRYASVREWIEKTPDVRY